MTIGRDPVGHSSLVIDWSLGLGHCSFPRADMLFNSLSFLLFFPLTTLVNFVLPQRVRWAWLLVCSFAFYAGLVPAYLLVLLLMIGVDYAAGLLIERSAGGVRRGWLVVSLLANVLILASFKYFNFFNENLRALAAFVGWNYPVENLGLLLPI